MNSRLASMRWPDRAATALAIEIDWPSATMVSAKARPISSGSCFQSICGGEKGGQGERDRAHHRDRREPQARAFPVESTAAAVPATSPISMKGQRRA